MKKQIIFGMLLLLCIGLCGCEEMGGKSTTLPDGTIVSGDIDKVELSNLSIITETRENFTVDWQKIGDGFIHNGGYEVYGHEQYYITATAKNVAGEILNEIQITTKFYDAANSYLDSETSSGHGIISGSTWPIIVHYINQVGNYFDKVDHISFEISVS